jgi:hypothetical protein
VSNNLNAIPSDTRWPTAHCGKCKNTIQYWSCINSGIFELECPRCFVWCQVENETIHPLKGTLRAAKARRQVVEHARDKHKAR